MVERTFGLIKTGALERGHREAILTVIAIEGLAVIERRPFGTRVFSSDMHLFTRLYAAHEGRKYYDDLINSVVALSVALVLEGTDAVARWRNLCGPTNPITARAEAPGSLRALYGGPEGAPMADNATHGSDSAESALREIAIFYPKLVK